jgi:hypothetical protein
VGQQVQAVAGSIRPELATLSPARTARLCRRCLASC